MRAHFEEWAEAAEMDMLHARRAGQPGPGTTSFGLAIALAFGPRPANEALATLDAVIADQPFPGTVLARAILLAMLDRIDEAWEIALPAEEHLRELGLASGGAWVADFAEIAGDYEAAALYMRAACDRLEAIGNTGELSTYAPALGRFLCKLGRHDEAEPLAQRGRELGDPDDVPTQQAWRQTQALVHAARGQHLEAEQLAREAVEFSLRSDSPLAQGNALSDLAEVLNAAGRRNEAIAALRQALECYDRKPIIPLAHRTRQRLVALEDEPSARRPATIP
jgi:tetratricopeptide (TPR) repeat protein